jgi:hypothetical protein
MVAVRVEELVFAMKLQVIVPVSVPLVPEITSQLSPEVTAAVHDIVTFPVLAMPNVAVPLSFATSRLAGDTDRTGCIIPACVTVTSRELPAAPVEVTWIVPVRAVGLVLPINAQVIVPELLPLAPDVIESQLPPDVTAAVQGIVPVPVLETLNVVVPAALATSRLAGDTDSGSAVKTTKIELQVTPFAVALILAVPTAEEYRRAATVPVASVETVIVVDVGPFIKCATVVVKTTKMPGVLICMPF